MEYDVILAPGANPRTFGFELDGIKGKRDAVRIDESGDLVIETPGGPIRQGRPTLYQQTGSGQVEVGGGYDIRRKTDGSVRIGFRVDSSYDRSRTLVIDPTFWISASGRQPVLSVATDAAGNWYLAGSTDSPDFPVKGPFSVHVPLRDLHAGELQLRVPRWLYRQAESGRRRDSLRHLPRRRRR